MLRELLAGNPSPMTLDGTRTFLIGLRVVAIIDPGPLLQPHLDAIADATRAASTTILLTHQHPDHAAGAESLAGRLGAPVRSLGHGNLIAGDVIRTDAGELLTLATPGHTPDHAAFHWRPANAVFCGDLMMGGLDTALVAPPEGNLARYLESLERLRALQPAVIHPAHGPAFTEPDRAIASYIAHRQARLEQVLRALEAGPLDTDGVARAVYRDAIPEALVAVAASATLAYLDYLREAGRVARSNDLWVLRGSARI